MCPLKCRIKVPVALILLQRYRFNFTLILVDDFFLLKINEFIKIESWLLPLLVTSISIPSAGSSLQAGLFHSC